MPNAAAAPLVICDLAFTVSNHGTDADVLLHQNKSCQDKFTMQLATPYRETT